jgi:hypothetical protein
MRTYAMAMTRAVPSERQNLAYVGEMWGGHRYGLDAFIFVKLVSTIQLVQVILAILGGVAGLAAL